MVSFWPWRRDDSSPASFEKALSALSTKITDTQARLDKTRTTARRVKVLWTLYLSFAYLVYSIVLVLVVGWKNMGAYEWTGISGGPILIYTTRTALTAFFNFRIDTLTSRLKDQQAERTKTVQRLKAATKYDSTLELLEKYGGEPVKGKKGKKGAGPEDEGQDDGQGKPKAGPGSRASTPARSGFTGLAPPATANIPRGDSRTPVSSPGTPQPGRPMQQFLPHQRQQPQGHQRQPSAEFAPNAFGPGELPPQPAQYPAGAIMAGAAVESHWYDRIMDLLLGEDETAAKNRFALICRQCRLVNGQAPPGTKRLAEVGRWKCMSCGAANGEMDEGERIVKEVLAQSGGRPATTSTGADSTDEGEDKAGQTDGSSDIVQVDKDEGQPEDDAQEGLRARKGKGDGSKSKK